MAAQKKGLYHSELVGMGAVKVKILGDVKPSKFKDKPPYVEMEIDGNLRQYQCENDDCAETLDERGGQNIMIEAKGSRGDATIQILGEGAAPEAPADKPWKKNQTSQASQGTTQTQSKAKTEPAQPAKTTQPANGGTAAPATGFSAARIRAAQFANAIRYGLNYGYLAAADLAKLKVEMSTEDIRSIAISIAIDQRDQGLIRYFPVKPIPFSLNPPTEE